MFRATLAARFDEAKSVLAAENAASRRTLSRG
jgi:hypothetical protein